MHHLWSRSGRNNSSNSTQVVESGSNNNGSNWTMKLCKIHIYSIIILTHPFPSISKRKRQWESDKSTQPTHRHRQKHIQTYITIYIYYIFHTIISAIWVMPFRKFKKTSHTNKINKNLSDRKINWKMLKPLTHTHNSYGSS